MPQPHCHLNLIVDVPVADLIAATARRHGVSNTSASRALMVERLALLEAGWDLDDPRRMTALEAVARLNEEKCTRLVDFLREELSNPRDATEGATAESA